MKHAATPIPAKARVLAVVATIPEGRVTTYGAIGRQVGTTARRVASIMSALTPDESASLPWFRVVAANGVISSFKTGTVGRRQVKRLRDEGITVTPRHKIVDFDTVMWEP